MENSKGFIPLPDIPTKFESAYDAYSVAFDIARAGDVLGWRQLIKRIKPNIFNSLVEWGQNKLDGEQPEHKEPFQVVDKAVKIISPLISVALVGVESGRKPFKDQKSTLYDLLNISGEISDEYPTWARIPHTLGYVYHSLHGSLCLNTNQLGLALKLAGAKISVFDGIKPSPVWENRELMRLPSLFSGNRKDGWGYLAEAYERWKWLAPIFGDDSEYRTSLVAYYMALHIHELASIIASGKQDTLNKNFDPKIPLDFVSEGHDINRRAISLLLCNPEAFTELWTSLNITRKQIEESWGDWISSSERWLKEIYAPSHTSVYHQHLF